MSHFRADKDKQDKSRSNKLLFVSHNGRPIDITYVNSILTACPTVDNQITTHFFRRTFITKAVEAGVSKELIAKQVGHVDNVIIDRI
ncbi:TPA: tyrosine-type recombinase/integrase, partial [Streptococcus suis]